MNHPFDVLQAALDDQKGLLRDDQPEMFKHLRADDGVADTGFVFETDENETMRCSRSLAANHIPGNANESSMSCLWQIRRAPNSWQSSPDQSHGMRARGQAHAIVIRANPFRII